MSLHAQCFSLGRALRLKADDLDTIRRDSSHDANQALNDILLLWLRQKYNVQRFGLPTWRMLVEAVDSPAGGNNHALAKKIASKYPLRECICYISLSHCLSTCQPSCIHTNITTH